MSRVYDKLMSSSKCGSGNKDLDLNSKSKGELHDMLRRQENLIGNRKFVASLPDGGKKIIDLKMKIIAALKAKEVLEETSSLLSKLSLGKIVPEHPTLNITDSPMESEEQPTAYSVAITDAYKTELAEKCATRFQPSKNVACVNRNKDSKIEALSHQRYHDTSLAPLKVVKPVKVLSIEESLDFEKMQKEKEANIARKKLLSKLGFSTSWQVTNVTNVPESGGEEMASESDTDY